MSSSGFPDFVKNLPEADLPFVGQGGWFLQTNSGQVLFIESDIEVAVPEHTHGDEWGVVIDGKIEIKAGDKSRTYRRGDTCFDADKPRSPHIFPGYLAVGYFADLDRYRPCSPEE